MSSIIYDRRSADSIFEYLKDKAEQLSNGRWTDFSDADIGTLILKLMSFLADMNNYQIDKNLSELYLDTLVERESALSLIKLIGYEPRWYETAHVQANIRLMPGFSVTNGKVIPRFVRFTNNTNSIKFYNIEPATWYENTAELTLYQGEYARETFKSEDISNSSRLYLANNKVDKKTIVITVANEILNQVENVLLDTSENLNYSVHVDAQDRLYVQLPSYYKDLVSSSTPIRIEYLITDGSDGRIGSNVLYKRYDDWSFNFDSSNVIVENILPSIGGYDPESVDEIKESAPKFASSMNTLVTLEDIEFVKSKIAGIADIVALDYNYPESGLIQPSADHEVNDAYRVNVYALPKEVDYIITPDQTLTDVGEELKEYIDSRRLTSIKIEYKNVDIVSPTIEINAYIDKYNLKAETLETDIKNVILSKYSRENGFGIGEPIHSSILSKQILDEIDYCNYIEILRPEDSYTCTKLQFLSVQEENLIVHVIEE